MTDYSASRKDIEQTFVLIVGGGPVGLLLALLLDHCGVPWNLVEAKTQPEEHSRAIGVSPPSQQILKRVGVLDELLQSGLPICEAYIHGSQSPRSGRRKTPSRKLDFTSLPDDPSLIISLPQARTEKILRKAIKERAPTRVHFGVEARSVAVTSDGVVVEAASSAGPTTFRASHLCGCDGVRSIVRDSTIGRGKQYRYPQMFAMGDFEDFSGLGDAAHLYFTQTGSVESFPLPGEIRRWIVQTDRYYESPPSRLITEVVHERSGHTLSEGHCFWQSGFTIRRSFAAAMARPPVFLAGDAAHTVPPIGGQGMNLGLGDAEHLADLLSLAHDAGEMAPELLKGYERRRFAATDHAGKLSIGGMRVGTTQGRVMAVIRDASLRMLLNTRLAERLMREFVMLAAPYSRSPWRYRLERSPEPNDREHTAQ